VISAVRVELDTTDIGLGFYTHDGVLLVGRPELHCTRKRKD